MLTINSDAKLKDLLEFPCSFTYKVMGYANLSFQKRYLK